MKYELPPFNQRTFKQHVGRFFEAIGALIGFAGILLFISWAWDLSKGDFVLWKLLQSILMVIIGIPMVGFGEWVYTPKKRRK